MGAPRFYVWKEWGREGLMLLSSASGRRRLALEFLQFFHLLEI